MPSQNSSIATAGPGGGPGFTIGAGTFNNIGGIVQDLFGASASKTQAKGNQQEAANYRQAAAFSRENEIYAKTTENIQEYQVGRANFQGLSTQEADIGGAGFGEHGTALYLMQDSARQGALASAVTTQQGQINIASYEEQAKSYDQMASAADMAAAAAKKSAKASTIGAIIKGVATVASIVAAPATGGASLLGLSALAG